MEFFLIISKNLETNYEIAHNTIKKFQTYVRQGVEYILSCCGLYCRRRKFNHKIFLKTVKNYLQNIYTP